VSLEQAWWEHLGTVRWFGGKGRAGAIAALEPLDWYTPAGAVPAVRSEIATIDYADGDREFYQLLVAHYPPGAAPVQALARADGADVVDATTDPAAVAAFVAAAQAGVPGMAWAHPQPAASRTSVWAGEQSNTTITLDGTALFKLFRRIEPGPNLDADVLAALDGTDAATPSLFGRLTAEWPAGVVTDLGIVIERVRDATDGWVLATDACAHARAFTAEARALGEALARVHARLADAFGTSAGAGDTLADAMTARLDAAASEVPALARRRDALAASFAALRGAMLEVQRVHGDFHLGQTLHSAAGWTIIDFEGEPVKSAAERRAPDTVWRDVAGMLRSFDYARSAHAEPSSADALAWAAAARAAFLDGYGGGRDLPAGLLAAYEADKAAYEVVYETRNRPDWVAIPLRAIEDLTTTIAG